MAKPVEAGEPAFGWGRGPVACTERVFDTGGVVVPAELRQVADRARPVTLARERTLPVTEPLQALLPDGALARGSAVAVAAAGATSLALNLVAAASRAGSWVVVLQGAIFVACVLGLRQGVYGQILHTYRRLVKPAKASAARQS